MGYVLSIFLNALQTWLYTKLWDSFFIRRFSGRKFWSYWLLWTAITTVIINVLPYDYDYINILRFLIEIALDYAMSLTLYRSRWDRRLFVVITGYSCFFSIAALTERALLFYSGMTQAEYASKSVEIFGDHIPTTKPEPELHGFGLPNVMDILHKYGVFYLMDYKDGSFLFCLEWPDTAKQKAVVTVQNK